MSGVLDTALGYLAVGLSVIPVRADGTKAPAEAGWRAYSQRQPTRDEIAGWFANGHLYGIGIPGGPASGNLAVLDFETWAAYETWLRSLPFPSQELTRPCPLVRAPRGGAHLYVRLTDPVPGTVLARHMVDGKPKTLIEVRGAGHQVVAPGSPASCHPTGREYEWLRRSWVDGGTWAPVALDEWFSWLERAAALNQVEHAPEAAHVKPDRRPREARDGAEPGSDFNRRGTWEETGLLAAGWAWHRSLGDDRGFVRRPGKEKSEGHSGTLGLVAARDGGWPLFYCFTTDGHPFEHQKSYSRFRVYAILKHKGDFSAAAKALGQLGYGDQSKGRGARGKGQEKTEEKAGSVSIVSNVVSNVSNAPAGVKPPLPLIYYAEITPALDAADFVDGLLIDGAMSVVYGESGCGKTFFVLDLALHVAGGIAWRGRTIEQRGVLYLALEGSHGIRNRIAAFKSANAANAVELPLAVVPVAIDLLSPEGDTLRVIEAAKLAAARLTVPVGLVVVDTLSRALAGGNENASEDMGALVRHLDLIRQALPAHLTVVHHSGKDTARGARGHSLLRAATDTEIEVSRDYVAKAAVARVTKQRELELAGEFAFRLHPVELGTDRKGRPVTSCIVQKAEPASDEQKATRATAADQEKKRKEREQNALDEQAVGLVVDAEIAAGRPGASRSWIDDHVDCSRARTTGAIERLLERGELVEVGPFQKRVGKGAMRTIKGGYGRPEKVEGSSE